MHHHHHADEVHGSGSLQPSGHHHRPTARRGLMMSLAVTATVMLAEAVGGYWSGSLSLLADAGHMLTDALALGLAVVAMVLGARPADDRRTFGYRRIEILAALANGVALIVISLGIIREAVTRFETPPSVDWRIMSAIALVGLIANVIGLSLLGGHRDDLNVKGAFLHMLGDTLSSVGVLVGGGVIGLTGFTRIDPALSIFIAVLILASSLSLLRDVVDVLLESTPPGIHTETVRQAVAGIAGVGSVHDLHIWSIASGMPALSAHIVVQNAAGDRDGVRKAVQCELKRRFGITHATLQLELDNDGDCCCCHECECGHDETEAAQNPNSAGTPHDDHAPHEHPEHAHH